MVGSKCGKSGMDILFELVWDWGSGIEVISGLLSRDVCEFFGVDAMKLDLFTNFTPEPQ